MAVVRSPIRSLALVAVVALAAVAAVACQPPRPDDRTKPVLLIHGWAAGGGTDCGATFDRMIGQLRDEGFTGPFVKVGFYTGDTDCDMTLRDWGSFSNGSSWVELSKALSAYVHGTYTSQGIAVDIVGYSMGGNIARGAVQGASAGEAGFAPPVMVEDLVALGAPYNGAAWYSNLCLWGQCATLKPGASAIVWLQGVGNPQGVGGTDHTAFGSSADAVTPVDSALAVEVPEARKVRYTDVAHTGSGNYLGRTDVVARVAISLATVNA